MSWVAREVGTGHLICQKNTRPRSGSVFFWQIKCPVSTPRATQLTPVLFLSHGIRPKCQKNVISLVLSCPLPLCNNVYLAIGSERMVLFEPSVDVNEWVQSFIYHMAGLISGQFGSDIIGVSGLFWHKLLKLAVTDFLHTATNHVTSVITQQGCSASNRGVLTHKNTYPNITAKLTWYQASHVVICDTGPIQWYSSI